MTSYTVVLLLYGFVIRRGPGLAIGGDVYEGKKVGWSLCLATVRIDSEVKWDPRVKASASRSELAYQRKLH